MLQLQLIDLYSRLCEVYDRQLVLHCFRHTKNGRQPRFSDVEALTCYLFATGWLGATTVRQAYDCMAWHYGDWFPDLPSYQAFNHRLNGLAEAWPLLLAHGCEGWHRQAYAGPSSCLLMDSFPVVSCQGNRRRSGRLAPALCTRGYCPMKRLYYYGVKVHVLAHRQEASLPLPLRVLLSPAHVHDLAAAQEWAGQVGPLSPRARWLVADKAYQSQELAEQWREATAAGVTLVTPHKRVPTLAPAQQSFAQAQQKLRNSALGSLRQSIESLFAWLVRDSALQQAGRVRSWRGMLVHIFGKMSAVIYRRLIAQLG